MNGLYEMPYVAPTSLPTVFDPVFKGCGQKVGLEIFRIEQLKVVKRPTNEKCYTGSFHSGDSYIVLQTKMRNDAFERHIYYWIGKESSQDEYGCCAYKTVELDTYLGGEPVQHREVQGHESAEFQSLFPAVQYLAGGVATGFKHVDKDAFTTRLLQVKGRRNIRVNQVEMSPKSMNTGDCFVLDAGRLIFQWNGSESSSAERMKTLEITRKIRDEERSGQAVIHVLEDGKSDAATEKLFWEKMGCAKTVIRNSASGISDEEFSRKGADAVFLYHVSDASGKLAITPVTARPLTKDMLNSSDCYVLDVVGSNLFAWVGKGATNNEKITASKMALDFIKSKGYPQWTPFTRVVENGETPLFKQNFKDWPEKDATARGGLGGGMKRRSTSVSQMKRTFSVGTMHNGGTGVQEKQTMVDDGQGKVEIWRVEKMELVSIPLGSTRQDFYGGDCYIILYTYKDKNQKECRIIYYWIGKTSSKDEYAAAAIHAMALDDKYKGDPVQIRVVMNKEPEHFYAIFKGKMVVHSGGKASGFKNSKAKDSYDADGTRLFQIKGSSPLNVRAVQCEEKASYLNSGDVFVLECPAAVYLWCGSGCTGDEREFAKAMVKNITTRDYTMIAETKEPAQFWEALGGKAAYANAKTLQTAQQKEPRLFQCSNAKGFFYVEEVFQFDQEDLIEDDVMLLDTGAEIFVWIGKGSNVEEKKKSLETAEAYVKSDPSGRKVDDVVFMQIKQGFEPPNFTGHFTAWSPNKWSSGLTYEDMKREALSKNPNIAALVPMTVKAAAAAINCEVYPYAVLIVSPPPEGVDLTKKEQYLNDAEFKQYLGCTKAEFAAMPTWKASTLKKKSKLF